MKAAEIMTIGVHTVTPDVTVRDAARLLIEQGISGLPVVDGTGQLVGMVTEGDFMRRAETGTQRRRPRWLEILVGPGRLASDYVRTHGRKVAEIMTPEVVSVSADTPVQDVVNIMEKHRIKRVPVVRDGAVVGIVSRANLVQALARLAEEAPPSRPDDEAMRGQIMAELKKQEWAPHPSLNVIVRDGVAELWGTLLDEKKRDAVRVLAENVPGIVGVQDHMVWVEPISGMAFPPPDANDNRPLGGPMVP
ncbi:MAG: CBS domain-containing protein [Hyphomicrobiales bacterium]|nr:CBS domain-containing protein [Hyphomicrobiales bacterium]